MAMCLFTRMQDLLQMNRCDNSQEQSDPDLSKIRKSHLFRNLQPKKRTKLQNNDPTGHIPESIAA